MYCRSTKKGLVPRAIMQLKRVPNVKQFDVCMCVCMCVCMYVCICVCVCVWRGVCICVWNCVCVWRVCMYVCMELCVCMGVMCADVQRI